MGLAVSLATGETVAGREFTALARSDDDLGAVASIRAALVARVRSCGSGGDWTSGGDSHRLVVPEVRALEERRPVFGIGFFGQARGDVDHEPILALERSLLARASRFRGLLAYHNVRFRTGQWGNLVLFEHEDDAARVREDPTHREALARTTEHYRSVRLHRLRFTDGALGDARPSLESTLLIDFGDTPPWRAVRRGAEPPVGICER